MNDFQAAEAIRRAAREAELLELEERTRQNEAAELAAALEKLPVWRREYDEAAKRAGVLRGEIVAVDAQIPAAVEALRLAHTTLQSLLAQRSDAERQVNSTHQRLSRLADWLGEAAIWRKDVVSIDAAPVAWRLAQYMGIPFPE